MFKDAKIYIAGHRGLVGSAILKNLLAKDYTNIIVRTHEELDLTNQAETELFFKTERPEYVFLAAAKVGGIVANNTYRADFIYSNIMIQNNVIHQSYKSGVKKLLFLGSTCIYPKNCPQPMKEDYLLTSELEYSNEPYAIAKIAGIKMCESYNLQYGTNFLSVMPTNLYGPEDNFDLEKSHVLPALIRKIYLAKLLKEGDYEKVLKDTRHRTIQEAKEYLKSFGVTEKSVEVWGTGKPKREFLWSEDMAEASIFIMNNCNFKDTYSPLDSHIKNTHINIGTGEDISISDLVELVNSIIKFDGDIVFNSNKPDGTFRKLTDIRKLKSLGWTHKIALETGIKRLFNWYITKNIDTKSNKRVD